MQTVVFESNAANFGPLVKARTVGQLRCGRHRLIDRVERLAGGPAGVFTRPFLAEWVTLMTGRPANVATDGPTLAVDACGLWERLPECDRPFAGYAGDRLACLFVDGGLTPGADLEAVAAALPRREADVRLFDWPWELVLANGARLEADWRAEGGVGTLKRAVDLGLTMPGVSEAGGVVLGGEARHGRDCVFKPGVVVDATGGPVVLGDRVKVGANATIEGPCFLDDDCVVQAHAHVREGVTAGPFCKLGGEIEESILQGFSNKQHHGFLGHSYLGEWINLGAGCTNSDLKNTYGTVRVPIHGDPAKVPEVETGGLFCGMTVGDYAKLGINTAAPTGAVVGFASHVVGPTAPKWTGDFRWRTDAGEEPLDGGRAAAMAERMMARRGRSLGEAGARLFGAIAGGA